MSFLYKSKDGVVNLAGLVISATTGVELSERNAELDAKVGKTLSRSEIKYAPVTVPTVTPIEVPVEEPVEEPAEPEVLVEEPVVEAVVV